MSIFGKMNTGGVRKRMRSAPVAAGVGPLANWGFLLAKTGDSVYFGSMKRIYDIADRAFLPWRFFGQNKSVIAAL